MRFTQRLPPVPTETKYTPLRASAMFTCNCDVCGTICTGRAIYLPTALYILISNLALSEPFKPTLTVLLAASYLIRFCDMVFACDEVNCRRRRRLFSPIFLRVSSASPTVSSSKNSSVSNNPYTIHPVLKSAKAAARSRPHISTGRRSAPSRSSPASSHRACPGRTGRRSKE